VDGRRAFLNGTHTQTSFRLDAEFWRWIQKGHNWALVTCSAAPQYFLFGKYMKTRPVTKSRPRQIARACDCVFPRIDIRSNKGGSFPFLIPSQGFDAAIEETLFRCIARAARPLTARPANECRNTDDHQSARRATVEIDGIATGTMPFKVERPGG
jgi:hypothetical protein